MRKFTRNLHDNLRVSRSGLLKAALIIVVLILLLVVLYTAFDLGTVLPKRRP